MICAWCKEEIKDEGDLGLCEECRKKFHRQYIIDRVLNKEDEDDKE